jgi:hypothetical protein
MQDRRLVGIDLGITSTHTVRVLCGHGTMVCRRKAVPTLASLVEVERAALTGTTPGSASRWCWSRLGPPGCRSRCSLCPRAHRGPGQLRQRP